MADIKVTGLSAITPPLDNGGLFLTSSYDGVSAYTSEKLTLTQLRDEVYLMEAEDKLTFDSSGTNKTFVTTATGEQINMQSADIEISTDAGTLAEGSVNLTSSDVVLAFDDSGVAAGGEIAINATNLRLKRNAKDFVTITDTNLNIGAGEDINIDTESKFVFDSSGTNKNAIEDSNSNAYLAFNQNGTNDASISADNTGAKGYVIVNDTQADLAFNNSGGDVLYGISARSTNVQFRANASILIQGDSTGLGFFGGTPVAKQTGVAVTAAGIHAALVNYGLIT
jgi:hypothetical protein